MAQRLLISGDNPEAVNTIRQIAEEGGLNVTTLGGEGDREWTWRDDHEAYERQRERLGGEHAGRYIAMYRGEVLATGGSAKEAARDGLKRIGRPASLFVVRAGEPLPEPEEVGMQMDAPRSVECEQ